MSESIHLCVASTNPVKVSAAKQAFIAVFPGAEIHCTEIKTPSGVADQPLSEAETRLGAENRVRYCANLKQNDGFDYFVAMEGGVDLFEEGAATFAYVSILSNKEELNTGRSANLPLPKQIFERLQNNEELGLVMDDVFNTSNIRQKGGAIGLLTNHAATRESIYTQALILTLAPILHPDYYR